MIAYVKSLLALFLIISSDLYILAILFFANRTEFEIGVTLSIYFITAFWQFILHGIILRWMKEGSSNLPYGKKTIIYAVIVIGLVFTVLFNEIMQLLKPETLQVILEPFLVFSILAIINSVSLYQKLKVSSKEKITLYENYVSNHIMLKLPFAFATAALYIYPNFPSYVTVQFKYYWIMVFFVYLVLADIWYYYVEHKYNDISRKLYEIKKPIILLFMTIIITASLAYIGVQLNFI